MATTLRSYCKINLGLAIGPGRADGFHALTTLYQTVGAYDLVTVSAAAARGRKGPISMHSKFWFPETMVRDWQISCWGQQR